MEAQHLPLDIISTLPRNIIEMILCLMPIRDAVRTSILSRKWRYNWVNIPKLVFDEKLFERSSNDRLFAIYQVLLLHHGPVLEFSLCMNVGDCFEIDQIIVHLSRNNTVQKFVLETGPNYGEYKLPSSFFVMDRLTHLTLRNCAFQPPSTFNGFSMLTSLYMDHVDITAKTLIYLVSNCPILKNLSMINFETYWGEDKPNIVELFECVPVLEHLDVSFGHDECLDAGEVPRKVSNSLVYLRSFNFFELDFGLQEDICFALLVIRSSPNLEKIKLEISEFTDRESTGSPELQDHSDVWLDRLNELEIGNFTNVSPEFEFLKLILATSPMLKKVRLELGPNVGSDEELKMLRNFLCLPRASPVVKIIVKHPYRD